MSIKKSIFRVDNGKVFDEFYFKTSADLVECNKDLNDEQGYIELPGGIIIQWVTTSLLQMAMDNRLGGGGGVLLPKKVNNIFSIERYIVEVNGADPDINTIKHFAIECTAKNEEKTPKSFVYLSYKWTKNEQSSTSINFKCKVVVIGTKGY